jgi:hypothetical protein
VPKGKLSRRGKRDVGPTFHLVGRPAALALDGSETGDLDEQKSIGIELRTLGVKMRALIDRLESMSARALLIQEARAQALAAYLQPNDVLRAKVATAVASIRDAAADYLQRLEGRDVAVPERNSAALRALTEALSDPFEELLEALALPGNALRSIAADDDSATIEHDATVRRYATARRQLGARQRRIAPGASLGSIQKRFMPEVRAIVCSAIIDALKRNGEDVYIRGRWFDLADVEDRETLAFQLTARFVRAFYPTWGASTTPQLVRKSYRSRKLSRSQCS